MIVWAAGRETAVVIAAVFGILAGISSQLIYVYSRLAEQPKYFGEHRSRLMSARRASAPAAHASEQHCAHLFVSRPRRYSLSPRLS